MTRHYINSFGKNATKPAPKSKPKPLTLAQSEAAIKKMVAKELGKITAKLEQERNLDKWLNQASEKLKLDAAKARFAALCLQHNLVQDCNTALYFSDLIVTESYFSMSDSEMLAIALQLSANIMNKYRAKASQHQRTSLADRRQQKYHIC